MKKIITIAGIAFLFVLLSAPSISQARTEIGYAYIETNSFDGVVTLYCDNTPVTRIQFYYGILYAFVNNSQYSLSYIRNNSLNNILDNGMLKAIYIPTLTEPFTWSVDGETRTAFTDLDDFENFLDPPPENIWEYYFDWYEDTFGYRPIAGSIYDFLKGLFDHNDPEVPLPEITLPTLTPTPSPTPTPTPIPVQTIFVPDGNGNTTIVYQYPDPTTGVITQSPYNPNIQNDITVNCNCDGGGGLGTFTIDPQDPYTLDASLLWADGFGVQMSDNPLSAVNDSQQTLNSAAMEYDESVNVLSNSFNIIPFKWLTLVGLCGGILIIAGLIRTFLGG